MKSIHFWDRTLESTYQTCLPHELTQQGIFVECEKSIPVLYKGTASDCGYRIDMMVEHGQFLIENKWDHFKFLISASNLSICSPAIPGSARPSVAAMTFPTR
ncbi:MAG: GxxExxY protein [Spirochaetaceae bacterium]|nr:GxxExxY protein [Spirochaetaceae bacterium]